MVWDAQLGRRLCDCVAHGMKNADGIEFPRSVLGASGIAIDYLWHSWLQPGMNLACCLSLYTHCRIYGFPPFNNTIFNNGLLTYRVADSGGRGLQIRLGALHPLCACVVAAAVDYTPVNEVL